MAAHKHPVPSRWRRAYACWKELTIEQKLGVASLPFIVLTFVAAALVVPEVRGWIHLKREAQVEAPVQSTPKPPTDLKNPEIGNQPPERPQYRIVPLPNAISPDETARPLMTFQPEKKPGVRQSVGVETALPGINGPSHKGSSQLASTKGMNDEIFVSADAAANYLIRRVDPTYPPVARQAGIQGKVVLRVRIAKDGTVEGVEIKSGNPLLGQAAQDAVKQWRYQPFKMGGEAVNAQTTTTLDFSIK
jgi:TonB family protein